MNRIKSPYITITSAALIFAVSDFGGACTMHETVTVHDVDSFCRHFVKVICTKDTAAFFSSVDKDDLTSYFRQKYPAEAQHIDSENVFFPFLFRYSPIVIRKQELSALRAKQKFFESFTEKIVRQNGTLRVGVNIDWRIDIPEEKPEHIYLVLRRVGDSWKVIGSDF
ncbi:MAG TPA: hypothetical protein VNV35_21640 [Puia sp.]|jgi:hypothetical protein|nr:hypothetical protein [Puia sp.]